jgi:hypothetical protein
MSVSRLSVLLTVGLFLAACSTTPAVEGKGEAKAVPPAAAQPVAVAPAAANPAQFGQSFTLTTPTSLTAILDAPESFSDKRVLTEGEVTAVCKSAGCWLRLSDGKKMIHVAMKDHGFSVPKDSKGKRMRIEGIVVKKEDAGNACGNADGCKNGVSDEGLVTTAEIVADGASLL